MGKVERNWEKMGQFSAEPDTRKNGKKKMLKEFKIVQSGAESGAEIITPEVTPEVAMMQSGTIP